MRSMLFVLFLASLAPCTWADDLVVQGVDSSSADTGDSPSGVSPGDNTYCANGNVDLPWTKDGGGDGSGHDETDVGIKRGQEVMEGSCEYCEEVSRLSSGDSSESHAYGGTYYNCLAGTTRKVKASLQVGLPHADGMAAAHGGSGGGGGGCGSCGVGGLMPEGMPFPGGTLGATRAIPRFALVYWSRDNTGAAPFGDQTHAYDIPLTQSYDASTTTTTIQLRLPDGGVRPTFISTNGTTFTAVKDRGHPHGGTMSVSGSTLTVHGPRGDIWTYTLPSGWSATLNGLVLPVTTIASPIAYPVTCTYNGSGEIQTASSLIGSLTYTWGTVSGYRVITGVTEADGRTLSFGYQVVSGHPRLGSMTHADGSQSTWTYDPTNRTLPGYTVTYHIRSVFTPNFANASARYREYWQDSIGRTALQEDALGRDRFWRPVNNINGGEMWRLIQRQTGSLWLAMFGGSAGKSAEVEFGQDAMRRFVLDSNQRVVSETDEKGRTTTYLWEGDTQYRSRINYADGSFEAWTRQAGTGQWLSHTDRLGRVTKWERDAFGRATARIQPDTTPGTDLDNPRITTDYNDAGQTVRRIDELGRVTTYFYATTGHVEDATATWNDAANHGLLVRVDAPGDAPATTVSWTYRWDANLDCVLAIDPSGRTFEWTYDALHRLVRADWNDGSYASWTYGTPTNASVAGHLVASRDRNGNVTSYEYDASGEQTGVVRPDGTRIDTTYDQHGRVTSVTDSGELTTFGYDATGRQTTVSRKPTASATLTTTTVYNPRSQPILVTDPYGRQTATVYNINDRPVRTVRGLVTNALSWTTAQAIADARLADSTWTSTDIGAVGLTGSTSGSGSAFTVDGAGAGALAGTDAFRYHWQYLPGEGAITVYVDPSSTGRAGVMVRNGTAANANFLEIVRNAAAGIEVHTRYIPGQNTPWKHYATNTNRWLRITRTSHAIASWSSPDGTTWTPVYLYAVPMGVDAQVGLCVSSGSQTSLATGVFTNVAVTKTNVLASVRDEEWASYLNALPRISTPNPDYVIEEQTVDAEGQTLAHHDGRNVSTTATYDVRGRLLTTTADASGTPATTAFTYDAASNRLTQTNPRQYANSSLGSTVWTYTNRDLVSTETVASGTAIAAVARTMTYSPTGKPATSTDALGRVTSYQYGVCCDRLVGITDPAGFVTSFTYDSYGNRLTTTDPNGLTTATTYDVRHRVATVTNGAGEVTTYTYDDNLADGVGLDSTYPAAVAGLGLGVTADGAAVAVTNPAGETALQVRDGVGRMVRSVDPLAHATTVAFDAVVSSLVETSVADALGHVTKSQADGAGQVRVGIDALGKISTAGFDSSGNRVSVRDANGVGMDCVFDGRNRDTTCTDTAGAVTSRTYDLNGNVVTSTDALSQVTTCTFDARDRKATCTDRIGGITAFAYDAVNNLLTITDAQSAVTTYGYNSRDLLTSELFPAGQQTGAPSGPSTDLRSYTYDSGRRLATRVDQAGITTTYVYDNANRLIERQYSDGKKDVFDYDLASRLEDADSDRYDVQVDRAYDVAGRLTSETQTINGTAYTVGYQYDADNRRTQVTYPGGSTVVEGWTDRNQLASVIYNSASVAVRTYDDGGRLLTTTLGNGLVETRAWPTTAGTRQNLVSSIAVPGVTGFGYSYDANKRKTAETDSVLPTLGQTFAYDAENRLTAWSRTDGTTATDTQSWTLSLVGDWNSTTRNAVVENRTHTPVHEVITAGASSLLYDQKGNLTKDEQAQGYAWDVENGLASATVPITATKFGKNASYRYDALGRRVEKTVNGKSTRFLHDGARVVREVDLPAVVSAGEQASDGTSANADLAPATGGMLQPGSGTVTRINFQPDTTQIPAGYYADKGRLYGVRTNGLTYGWSLDATGRTVKANGAVDLVELNTHVRMQPPSTTAGVWEIALPNGSYPVVVMMGDPLSTLQTNNVTVEGTAFTDPDPSASAGYTAGDFDGYATTVTVSDGALTITVGSGADDPKICFVEIGPEGTSVDAAVTTRLNDLVARATDATWEMPGPTNAAREYVYGSYVDESLLYVNGSTKYYVSANHLYSPAALTDAAGAVAERYRYDAYGKRAVMNGAGVAIPGSTVGFQRGFTGYQLDAETVLYYARNRMYDPGLGRFVSRDPGLTPMSKGAPIAVMPGTRNTEQLRGYLIQKPYAGRGYHDGMGLYAGYFAPNYLDPTGLLCGTWTVKATKIHAGGFLGEPAYEVTFDSTGCPCVCGTIVQAIDPHGVWSSSPHIDTDLAITPKGVGDPPGYTDGGGLASPAGAPGYVDAPGVAGLIGGSNGFFSLEACAYCVVGGVRTLLGCITFQWDSTTTPPSLIGGGTGVPSVGQGGLMKDAIKAWVP